MFLIFFSTLLLGFVTSNYLPNDPYHNCATSEQCSNGLAAMYPDLRFVCCSTVVCAYDGTYFLLTSTCSTDTECSEVAFNGTARFAARLEKVHWDTIEKQVNSRCQVAAKTIVTHPNVMVSQNRNHAKVVLSSTKNIMKMKSKQDIRQNCDLKCKNGEDCCTRVECDEMGDEKKKREYSLEQRCSRDCHTFGYSLLPKAHYVFSSNDWAKRLTYERKMSASFVEKSCRETRYFHRWLITQN